MNDFKKYISDKRRAAETPQNIVNSDGSCNFGTYKSEFPNLDFSAIKKPTRAPQCFTKYKLTRWQAAEVHLKEGILLAAICHMGLFGMILNVFFDKRQKKVISWTADLPASKTVIAPNLLCGSVSEGKNKRARILCRNNLEAGELALLGEHKSADGKIEYDFKFERISLPSIVSIPFGENRPVYSQKDFFKASGKLTVNGEELSADEDTVAILDDHRGFYPRKMHFDWATTLGRQLNGNKEYFALNLTQNQSVNPFDFNENLIWREGRTDLLPPVIFERNISTKKGLKKGEKCVWSVSDKYDMVRAELALDDAFRMEIHAAVVKIEYYIVFGVLSGYVRDEDGNKLSLDGLVGMGEDKTMLF